MLSKYRVIEDEAAVVVVVVGRGVVGGVNLSNVLLKKF